MVEAIVILVIGGALGYGIRGTIGKEVKALGADLKASTAELKAHVSAEVASLKAKV